jgi:hypothetical protein
LPIAASNSHTGRTSAAPAFAASFALPDRLAVSLLRQDPAAKAGAKGKRKRTGWDEDYLLPLLFDNE